MKLCSHSKMLRLAAISAALLASQAYAEVPAATLTTIGTALTDVGVLGAAIFGIVIAIAVWGWFRRVVK